MEAASYGSIGLPQELSKESSGVKRNRNDNTDEHGSSAKGATLNFVNSIVGAGAIGMGGAIASSGGIIGILCVVFFAFLTKLSFDVVIDLTVVKTAPGSQSYEELGRVAYGAHGHHAVLFCRFLYSFGCLVAYVVIVKDNAASTLLQFLNDNEATRGEDLITWILSAMIVLPLCLLRHMALLEKASIINFFVLLFILGIVVYVLCANPDGEERVTEGTAYEHWFQIRPGLFESLGTFVFTFVSQHNIHQIYHSLRSDIRNPKNFHRVSSWAVSFSALFTLGLGLSVYMTFWESTTSDMLAGYRKTRLHVIDAAKLLLSFEMMLTFPLPFFVCRELIILSVLHVTSPGDTRQDVQKDEETLLQKQDHMLDEHKDALAPEPSPPFPEDRWWLLKTHGRHDLQLILPYHVLVTVVLWVAPTFLAIAAPSLGDVLNLVGAATGTLIAFILPALFLFRLHGQTLVGWLILVVGGVVGLVGTVYSTKKLFQDASIE